MDAGSANAIPSQPASGPDATSRDDLAGMLAEMRRFIDRRFCELSVEVHGAVQLLDMSETNLSGQISAIHAQVADMVAAPMAETRNSGVELEAVVQATEDAAGRILDAAEAIGNWVAEGRTDPQGYEMLAAKVNAIFEACAFQDLTGQRIRRAIDHLQRIESVLGRMMQAVPPLPAAEAAQSAPAALPFEAPDDAWNASNTADHAAANNDLLQAEIDSLLE